LAISSALALVIACKLKAPNVWRLVPTAANRLWRLAGIGLCVALAGCSQAGQPAGGASASSKPSATGQASASASPSPNGSASAAASASAAEASALRQSATGRASAAVSPSAAGSGLVSLFASGASVLDMKPLGDSAAAVLVKLPGAPASGSVPPGPPAAELATVSSPSNNPVLAKAVIQEFAQNPLLAVHPVGGKATAAMVFRTGANSAGLIAIRDDAVVYDGTADDVQLQDLDGTGSSEIVKSWSPFCGNHAASPRLTTVYAWQAGQFVSATSRFPAVINKDMAAFQSALAKAGQDTVIWTPTAQACLHDGLAYLAGLSGEAARAAAEQAQVRKLDPSYDVDAVSKAAAGEPAETMPLPSAGARSSR
jgi:hypothetical protein